MGNKFVPNYFFKTIDFFNYLLEELDNNLLDLNKNIFFKNNKTSSSYSNYNEYDSFNKKLNEFSLSNEYFRCIFKKMHTKYIHNNENFFISKEINDLRSNIHSNLFNNYDNIKIKPNINYTMLKDLFKFKKERSFKIINCDKNVGIAILSNELYSTSALEFLNSDITFNRLAEDPLYITVNFIKNETLNLCNLGHISNRLFKTILKDIDKCKLGSFRLLAKLHKPKFSWRPIINCKNHPNNRICYLIDQILRPIVIRTETYIKDSQNLILNTKDITFEKKPFLYSLDIVNLYTNIKPDHAVEIITQFMSKYIDCFDINIVGLNKLLKIMFNTNVFSFEMNFYKQIKGLPMGCICGPMVANLYVYILEIKWYNLEKPLIHSRFIDDNFLALLNELDLNKFQENFIYLEFTETSGEIVNFLDLFISYDSLTKKLKFSVYIKPTNSFGYLRVNSNHPPHIFKNLPKCLFLRNKKICTRFYDYILISKLHIDQLEKRGYDRIKLIKLCKTIGNLDRNSLLPYKDKSLNNFLSENINYILYFHYFNYNLNIQSIIYNCFKSIFKKIILKYINKVNCNLNNALIHNAKMIKFTNFKTKKCNNKKCKICKFIYARHYINLDKYSNIKIKLKSNSTCSSDNLIYIIICLKCNLFYVGETGTSLNVRIRQHLNHIIKFKPFEKHHDKEVARHFRSTGHSLKHFKVCVFKTNLPDVKIRKDFELDLINRLNINKKRCINIFKTKNNKKFVFKN